MFDIHGGYQSEHEHTLTLDASWPDNQQQAKHQVQRYLTDNGLGHVPSMYYEEPHLHDWYDRKRELILLPGESDSTATLIIKEHDIWMQLLFIHKGIAGPAFTVLGILFGIHLFISAFTGVVLALQMPAIKKSSLLFTLTGTLVLGTLLLWL